ncbi:hypothetical protein [Devriesea agamarum]|uniref:hypothetical protein n=1 Tax=Devriesea agamarum TaxID=472569 RepID=UPI00071C71C0|nr:hypothetical protein [Devriesea agamarum]
MDLSHRPPRPHGADSTPGIATKYIVTLIIGAFLTVCGPGLGVLIGTISLVPSAFGSAKHSQLSPSTSIDLDAGESVFLLVPVAELEFANYRECTAKASDGVEAAVSYQPASALNTIANGTRYESFGSITAEKAGTYTVSCGTQKNVIMAPPFDIGFIFGPFGWWTAGGFLVSLGGIVMVIISIVRLATSTKAT